MHRCETFSSLLLLGLRCQCHEKTSLSRGRKMCARDWDFPWPPPKAAAGKPSRWRCGCVRSVRKCELGITLPDRVTAAVPCAWFPGDSLASTGVSDAAVVAANNLAKCEAVAKMLVYASETWDDYPCPMTHKLKQRNEEC